MRVAFIIVVLGLTVAAPAERQWVGGSGVNSDWWWYGNSDTVHGDYNDSNSPDAAGRAAHDSIANDPNAGLNHPGTPGNDEIAQASAAMDAAQARVERAFESSPEWTNAVADSESGKRAYHKARAEVVKALSERADYTSAAEASAAADRTVESSRATTTATQAEMHAAAVAAMAARTAITQLETAACAADPAVAAAQTRTKNAAEALRQLRSKERAAVMANAEWQSARQRYDSARTQQVLSAN